MIVSPKIAYLSVLTAILCLSSTAFAEKTYSVRFDQSNHISRKSPGRCWAFSINWIDVFDERVGGTEAGRRIARISGRSDNSNRFDAIHRRYKRTFDRLQAEGKETLEIDLETIKEIANDLRRSKLEVAKRKYTRLIIHGEEDSIDDAADELRDLLHDDDRRNTFYVIGIDFEDGTAHAVAAYGDPDNQRAALFDANLGEKGYDNITSKDIKTWLEQVTGGDAVAKIDFVGVKRVSR